VSKSKYRKAIESLDKRIEEHREKLSTAKYPELHHYWEKEIRKFELEKRKRQKRA